MDNPYAAPASPLDSTPAGPVWRQDWLVVCQDGAQLPERCIVCNAPADGDAMIKTLYWHHWAFSLLWVLNPVLYAIIALIVRKKSRLCFSLCPSHRARRRRGIRFSVGGLVLGFTAAVVGTALNMDFDWKLGLAGAGIALVIVAPVVGSILATVLHVQRIERGRAYLRLGAEFTESIPFG
ncbi:MAG: hypothetical protein KDC87_10825 [Planctomycetes bacterium]|nr:hypothetical protein [Planctomycetota bacterium]